MNARFLPLTETSAALRPALIVYVGERVDDLGAGKMEPS